MAVTEVATLPLKAGTNINDKNSLAGKAWIAALDIIARQDGYQGAWYGHKEESPDVAQIFINWKSLSDHQAFMAAPDYQPMLERFGSLIDGAPSLTHFEVASTTAQKGAFAAPMTELVIIYLDAPSSDFDAALQKFADAMSKDSAGPLSIYASGYSIEEVEHEKLEGGKGKAKLLAIGWPSIEAHIAFRDTAVFKDNVALLREGPKALVMHHVKLTAF